MARIPVLWLCGPPGVGKTAVAWEIYERLRRDGRAPAYVDVDQLGMCYPERADDSARHRLKADNVGALRANYATAGARCLIVSGVVDGSRGPEIEGVGGGAITTCRLRAEPAELLARLDARRGSFAQPEAAVREAELLDGSRFTDWCVDTTELSVGAVSDEVVARLGDWPGAADDAGDASANRDADRESPPGNLLWLCGPTGVGKSTVGFSLYLEVLQAGVSAAYVDADQLGFCGRGAIDHRLRARNLAAVWRNFHSAGASSLVVVGPLATNSHVATYERALPAATFTWCRLLAGKSELTRRVLTRRDGGSWPQPGDPLRGRSERELLAAARRALAESGGLERRGIGLGVDVGEFAAAEAADRILATTRWPSRPLT